MSTATSVVCSLKCEPGDGMFPHEKSVLIAGVERNYEMLVDAEFVRLSGESDQTGWIDVTPVTTQGDRVLVELPRQVISGGRRIWVPASELDTHGHSLAAGD